MLLQKSIFLQMVIIDRNYIGENAGRLRGVSDLDLIRVQNSITV